MIRKYAVIKSYFKTHWFYWSTEDSWTDDLLKARQFPSKEVAEIFLMMQKDWDDNYSIQECFTQYVYK